MKTRIKYIVASFITLFALQSCEKWFDVTASDQIKAEDQFSSGDGFRDALTGIYLAMGTESLYGKDMTFNMIDILAQQYQPFTGASAKYNDMQNFRYSTTRSEEHIQRIWDKFYFAIANVNTALSYLEKSDFVWYPGEKEIIEGELLALRAFLHFDLMRVFGHSNYENRSDLTSKMAIPYSTMYSKEIIPQLSYTETFELLESDIATALDLLKYDPVHPNTLLTEAQLVEINREGFYSKRDGRMNYFAVKALQARVYAWQGGQKWKLAVQAAEEVIEKSAAKLAAVDLDISWNKTVSSEYLFGLHITNHSLIAAPLFSANSNTDYDVLRLGDEAIEELYETAVPEIGVVDFRYSSLIDRGAYGLFSSKLNRYFNSLDYDKMPLIKLPEMYYIAAEYYSKNNLSKAIALLQEVRASRRIVHELPKQMSVEDFQEELMKEYRKEYIAEGQLFFYYKRIGLLHMPNISNDIIVDDAIYMLPFPMSEIEFGNRVQN
ncbi:RagB/SusD family nutrient uptake outer membrane protein [Sphingobacterium sp. UT-1RO-CII-1]|uniref:RagB/SusD family nutrient uptake outer membrane protein n=1 Tax=Sphingobacterium sp. UT-1RO-CII-1 TaxID=2995225 RepID=UPI00227C1703|nr:RagB/SusD family nutrient uptake outer membrane protein [Sphingobacterium sp. UT-1RO-CII-1]MCY4780735.1 RagB/SusD family nutrient uptake outer membrane protein [Sphingobacterium sp. UT-1RO-CII-1]